MKGAYSSIYPLVLNKLSGKSYLGTRAGAVIELECRFRQALYSTIYYTIYSKIDMKAKCAVLKRIGTQRKQGRTTKEYNI